MTPHDPTEYSPTGPHSSPHEPSSLPPPHQSPPPTSEWAQLSRTAPSNLPTGMVRKAVKELLETAIYIVLVFIIVRSIVQNFRIEGSSMEPTLHSGQYILVNKLVYFNFDVNAPLRLLPGYADIPTRVIYPLGMPQRGDVVVFEYPKDLTKDYIKRVIGLPGETVEIRDGRVYVNDQMLQEPYLEGSMTYCNVGTACNKGPVVVPNGTIFVMGDNRSNSSDSREWNALALDRVIGQAWLLYYPVSDLGFVPHPSYATDESPNP